MGTGSSKEEQPSSKEEQPSSKEEQPSSKEEQEKQLKLLEQEMKVGTGTPFEKKQKEIQYYKLFYQIYKYSSTKQTLISEEQYDQHMRKLYEELEKLKKQEELEGWDPPQQASDTETEMNTYNGGKKKSKSKKSKSKKSKSKKSKSKRSKRTKK
jgi:hypothetical protein